MLTSPLAKKVFFIALLLILFPVLLKIGFYIFVFILFLLLALWVAAYMIRQKILTQLMHFIQKNPSTPPYAQNQQGRMRQGPDRGSNEDIVIDVTAERR